MIDREETVPMAKEGLETSTYIGIFTKIKLFDIFHMSDMSRGILR